MKEQVIEKKAAHERLVFIEFARVAGLPIDEATVESRPAGEPDIRCMMADHAVYFELARLLDQGMQRLRLKAMRVAPQQVGPNYADVKLPEREILRVKLAKHYVTNGAPIELLLYYDNENWLVGDVPAVADFAWHAEHVMLPIINVFPRLFRRTWVYERHRPSILWCHPSELSIGQPIAPANRSPATGSR